jgi:hypothetical protein
MNNFDEAASGEILVKSVSTELFIILTILPVLYWMA